MERPSSSGSRPVGGSRAYDVKRHHNEQRELKRYNNDGNDKNYKHEHQRTNSDSFREKYPEERQDYKSQKQHTLQDREKLEKTLERRVEERKEIIDSAQCCGQPTRQPTLTTSTTFKVIGEGKDLSQPKSSSMLNGQSSVELRWDDPARHFVDSLRPERPKFRAPPNRFDILPGQRWDGIDRSNGFERRLFQQAASKTARRELAYRHDYEDL